MIGVERPSDWSALGFDCDPVPGDPVAVRAGAVSWTALADQISHCAQSLRALEAGASRGADSVAALLEARDEIVDQVGVMEARYRQYAVVLDRAQSESLRAWYAARDAQGELDAAVGRSESFTRSAQDAGVAGDDEERARCTRLAGAAEADAACARGRIAAQQQVVTAAVEQRDTAAVRAMGLIAAAKDADGVADSWWDDWGRRCARACSNTSSSSRARRARPARFWGRWGCAPCSAREGFPLFCAIDSGTPWSDSSARRACSWGCGPKCGTVFRDSRRQELRGPVCQI